MILCVGPFFGNFEEEIIKFRPYVHWLKENLSYDNIVIKTHYNRFFLYENDIKKIHIDKSFTRFEDKNIIDMSIEKKNFVKEVEQKFNDEIDIYNINNNVTFFNKIFKRISIQKDKKNHIVFIPHNIEKEEKLQIVFNHLLNKYSINITGDTNTYLQDKITVINMPDYIENGYKYILEDIMEAKAVICPAGFWTAICNIQKIPVFSWGSLANMYKENGLYYFNNKKSMMFNSDNKTKTKNIISMIDYFLLDFLK